MKPDLEKFVRLPFVLKTCEILQVILCGQSQPGICHVGEKMRKISLDKERSYKRVLDSENTA